jgi:hypothetical protein
MGQRSQNRIVEEVGQILGKSWPQQAEKHLSELVPVRE